MQFVLLILSLMLTTTYAEALTKRSQSAKVAFKHQHPATGSPRGPCKGYVIDHIVPIACPDEPSNMPWQTVADAKAKDKWERKGCRKLPDVITKWTSDATMSRTR